MYSYILTDDYVSFLKDELSNWIIDYVLEFGSTANGEAISSSDFDLFGVIHAYDKIHISESYRRRRDYDSYKSSLDNGTRSMNLRFVGGDIRDQLNQRWVSTHQGSRKIWISHPLCDVRWLMRLLASEDEGYTFIYLTMGEPILDDYGFLKDLVSMLTRDRPFHWGTDSGIVHTLQSICSDAENRLLEDLGKVESGENRDAEDKVLWLYPAAYCIRYLIGLHSFVEEGFPAWSRQAVLDRIDKNFPSFYELADLIYHYKSNEDGRTEFLDRLEKERNTLVAEIHTLTDTLINLYNEVFADIKNRQHSQDTAIPIDVPDWFERNKSLYDKFLNRYLSARF